MDTHGMKFTVDTSDVAKGFRDYKAAVEGIFTSLDKFESHVNKTMQGVAKASSNPAALNAFKKSVQGFSNVDIDASAAKKLSALSQAMTGFKAPSSAQAANAKAFFNAFAKLPDLGRAYRSIKAIDDINIAMRGFKAPSATESANLVRFAKAIQTTAPAFEALNRIKGLSGGLAQLTALGNSMNNLRPPSAGAVTNLGNFALAMRSFNFGNLNNSAGLFATIAALRDFRAPSQNQVKNLENFAHAVSQIKVPPNGAAISAYLGSISEAAAKANGNMVRFRGGMTQSGGAFSSFNSGARSAHIEMMGLQNAFSGTFQVGSLLRSLLGSLTIGELGRKFFDATQTANQFAASMEVINESPAFRADAWNRVTEAANHFGADLTDYSEGFAKFAVAAHESGMSLKESTKVYEGFQTVMTALHLGKEQQNSVGLAIREIMDRGYVSTQQLTRQLGLVLPGALATLQKEWVKAGHAEGSFFDALKKKQVDGKWALDELANHYRDVYGKAVAQALESPIQQFTILKNKIMEMMIAISDSGAKKAFADLIGQISGYLDPDKVHNFATAIGQGLTKAVTRVSQAVAWLHDHWDSIKGPLSTILSLTGRWMMMTAAFKLTQALVTPLFNAVGLMRTLVTLTAELDMARAAGSAQSILGTLQKMNTPLKTIGGAMGSLFPAATGLRFLGGLADIMNAGFGGLFKSLGGSASKAGSAILMALTTPIEGGLAAALGTIVAGFGAAFLSITTVAHANGIQMASDQYTTAEKVRGAFLYMGDAISGIWGSVTDWINTKAVWLGGVLGTPFKGAGDLIATVFMGIVYVFRKVGELLIQTAATIGEAIGREMGSVVGLMTHGASGQWGAAAKDVGDLLGGNLTTALKNHLGKVKVSREDFAQFAKDSALGLDSLLTKAGERGRGKPSTAAAPRPPKPWQDATGDGPFDSNYSGVGKDNKSKADKAFNQLKAFQNAIDTLMKKLDVDDPVGKIMDDWTGTITKAGQTLLTKSGYMQFLDNLKKNARTTGGEVDALAEAMKNGLDPKVASDLAKRFHMSVSDLIEKFRVAAAETNEKMNAVLIKAFDAKFKKSREAMAALGDTNPALKEQMNFSDALEKNASTFLNPEALKAFLPTLEKVQSGAITAAQAADALTLSLRGTGSASDLTAAQTDMLVTALQRKAAASAFIKQQALEEEQFGAKRLRQMREEGLLASMSEKSSKVYAEVLAEVNERRKQGLPVTQGLINTYIGEATAIQKVNDQLARNNDFFKSNGVRSYINDIRDVGSAINDLDKNALSSLSDSIVEFGKTGKLSFKSLFDTIQTGILKMSADTIIKEGLGGLFGKDKMENGTPSLFGGSIGKLFGGYKPKQTAPLGERYNPMYVYVTNDGKLGTGAGGNTGNPILDAAQAARNGTSADVLQGAINSAAGNSPQSAVDNKIAEVTQSTATNFGDTMKGMFPLISMGFAASFKSPIAQIGTMFLSMMMTKMMSGGGGGGGIGGILGSLFGGGGGGLAASVADTMAANPGIFLEGGYPSAPVARMAVHPSVFAGAPHYAEGTHNTSGGMPAILHDNEAVIPLSRGRKVPVEVPGGMGGTRVVNNWNITTPNPDGFRRSKQQIASDMHSASTRAWSRNNR